jgi:hypothetical protein
MNFEGASLRNIIDNISFDGTNNPFKGPHTAWEYNIWVGVQDVSLNNINSFNGWRGMYIGSTSFDAVSNSRFYSNSMH